MKYLKYFEDVDTNLEPKIEAGQEWIKNDKSNTLIIRSVNEESKKVIVILKEEKNKTQELDIKYILDNYTLMKNESYNDNELDFNKTIYIPSDKSIIGAYFIKEQNDKSITILNVKEYMKDSTYVDNAIPYTISVETKTLSLNDIEVLQEDKYRKGFFYIKMPYWFYKNNISQLEIKRIKAPHKRVDFQAKDLRNKKITDIFKDKSILDYFKSSNSDNQTQKNVENFYKRANLT